MKPANHFCSLLLRIGRTGTISVDDDTVHQEPAVAGKKGALLGQHDIEELAIIQVRAVSDIEPEEAKITGELAQMTIRDKAIRVPMLQSRAGSLEPAKINGINIDIAIFS